MKVFTVSEFNQSIKTYLEEGMPEVCVEGEVSAFRRAKEKLVYFELKDEKSRVLCFLMVWELNVPLEDGMAVRVYGRPSMFLTSGSFHLRVREIELVGEGALRKALERLTKKLESEGLFAPERKRPLPPFPERIGLITSPDGAAYTDVLKILGQRWGGLFIRFFPVAVQGRGAIRQIVGALRHFSEKERVDLVILTRGGGSLEDLQAFNSEEVARAMFGSKPPLISGVGHERDWTIADLVADVRATTPTNAAQLAVPDRQEVARLIHDHVRILTEQLKDVTAERSADVDAALTTFEAFFTRQRDEFRRIIATVLEQAFQLRHEAAIRLRDTQERARTLVLAYTEALRRFKARLENAVRLVTTLSPQATLERGFSITFDEERKVIRSAKAIAKGQRVTTKVRDGSFHSTVSEEI